MKTSFHYIVQLITLALLFNSISHEKSIRVACIDRISISKAKSSRKTNSLASIDIKAYYTHDA